MITHNNCLNWLFNTCSIGIKIETVFNEYGIVEYIKYN